MDKEDDGYIEAQKEFRTATRVLGISMVFLLLLCRLLYRACVDGMALPVAQVAMANDTLIG